MLSNVVTKSREVTFLGDKNVGYLKKKDNLAIKNIFHLYSFQQIVTKPTRITEYSKTLIDTIFTTNTSTISAHDVIPTSIADHDMVGYVRKINCIKFNSKTIRCRNYAKYDHVKMCKELKEINWEPLYPYTDVNAAWCFIKDKLTTVFHRHAPFIEKQVEDRFCLLLSTEICQQMNNRDKTLRKASKTDNKTDWNFYKTLRNHYVNSIREAKTNCNKNLLAENSNNPSRFWKIIKEIIPIKCKNATSRSLFIEAESKKVSDPVKILNTFCSFFTNVASTIKRDSLLLKDFIWCNPPKINKTMSPQFTFQYVPRIFIEKELKRLKKNKATGVGDLPPNLLKYSAVEIPSPLCFLINLSLKTVKVPT